MSKSLGQIFYEALIAAAKAGGHDDGSPWEPWDELPDSESICIESAAQAVRAAVLADVPEIPK